jgi:hypothetical protein
VIVMTEFPHPSRPGYYGQTLSARTRDAATLVVDTLIPEGDGYPAASEAAVVDYIEARCSPADVSLLKELCEPALDSVDPVAYLAGLETSRPEEFTWLLQFTYHGYYSSNLVLAALNRQGYDYHGAPQPFGYGIDTEPPVPGARRGTFIKTSEVKNVATNR